MPADGIERASADDVVSLATDVGPAPMQVGAVLLIDPPTGLTADEVVGAIGERIVAVPRLRQVLEPTPPGCGRPIWVDDMAFALGRQVRVIACPSPGDEAALLAVAAEVIDTPLPRDQPLWRIGVVTGLADDRVALVVAFHHVLADGIGGLAVLAHLVDQVDQSPAVEPRRFPRPAPSKAALASDAWRSRLAALGRVPEGARRVRAALGQLRLVGGERPAPCSLTRPTGPRRAFAVARARVDDLRAVGHRHGATVNDIVLTAITAALHELLGRRGETVDRFVISVPVSSRTQAGATRLGNEVGVVPLGLPGAGPWPERLGAIAAATRAAKATPRAASSAVLGPAFRALAAVGLFRWFINRQRLVHTFATNVRGPDEPLRFLGAAIADVVPVAVVTGNVTVAFAALSYAGTLAITVIADPDACPAVDDLSELLQARLDEMTATPG